MSEPGKSVRFSPRVLFRAGIIFLCLFTVFTLQLPFYGDHVSIISTPANYYIDHGFSSLILPDEIGTGHPPLYVLLHVFAWDIFGRSLAVSHLITFFAAVFLYFQFYRLCRKWLSEREQLIALLLFLLQPVVITQVSMMSIDILLCGLFLCGLNAILSGKRKLLFVAVACSMLISARGIISAGLLFMAEFILAGVQRKEICKLVLQYVCATVPAALWYLYHYLETGWIFSGPASPWARGREWITWRLLPFKTFEYGLRYLEFGMIIPWLVILLFWKRWVKAETKSYFLYLLLSVVFFSLFIIFFRNPVMIRYILPLQLIVLILFAKAITQFVKLRWQKPMTGISLFVFAAHHFFAYPQMRSSIFEYSWGEGALAHLSYFQFREEAMNYLEAQHIDAQDVFTGFPDYKDVYDTDLGDRHVQYHTLKEDSLSAYPYVIYSNLMNGITKTTELELKQNWVRIRTWYAYPVEYILLKNPGYREDGILKID